MAHSGKTITFATDLLPQEDNIYSLGYGNQRWKIYGELQPLTTKTYTASLYNSSSGANFYQNFATVTPADYNAIWIAHYRITITASGHSDYTEICDVSISGRANTYYSYKIYNSIVTYSIYQHMLLNSSSASTPHELGYRMASSYGATDIQKMVKVELLEQINCTVTLLDSLKLYTSATPSGYAAWRGFNATSNGLQEAGDSNDTGLYIYSNGFRGKAGSNKVYRYCLFARTGDGTYESFVMQDNTRATTKTANPHGFVPDGKIYWNSGNSTYSAGALNISAYEQYHVIDYLYSFNFDNQFLTDYCETYVVYTYNEEDGLLYLDTTQWLAAALPTTADGKIYQRIGSKYYTGTSNYYQGSLLLENPYYEYRDGEIRSWSATHLSSITGADDLKAIEAISGTTGLLKKTAANTWALDTTAYTTNKGTVTSVQVQASSPLQSSTNTAQNTTLSTTISFTNQNKNLVLAGPSSGNAAAPSFRALVAADIPALAYVPVASNVSNDINTYYNTGIYNITTGSLTNGPVGYGYGQLLVMSYRKPSGNTTTDWATQLYSHLGSGNNGNTLYYRTSNASTWQTWQMAIHADAGTTKGSTTTPVYVNAKGEIQEGTALKNLAYKDSLTASDIPDLSWNKITSDKPDYTTRWPKWNEISQSGAESINEGTSDVSDNTEILTSYASNNGFADTHGKGIVYRRDAIHIYNYINGKLGTMAHETASNYAKLDSPTFTGTPKSVTPSSTSDNTMIATKEYVDGIVAANDAMVYKGIKAGAATSSSNAYGALTPAANCGDTYKVSAAGFINGLRVEVGDMLICTADNTAEATSSNYTTIRNNWNIIQTSEGSVSSSSTSSLDNALAVWDSTSGRIIKSQSTITYIPATDAELGTTKGKVTGLFITGTTYGNTAANLASNTANVFRYGDPGPQIRFGASASAGELGAIIWSDNSTSNNLDSAFYFVSRSGTNNAEGNVGVVTKNLIARTSLMVGSNYRNPSYTAYLNGTTYINGALTTTGTVNLTPASGEGGELHLNASTANTTEAGIILDHYANSLRIFGIASADGTTKTGVGTALVIDPYEKTITGGYTFDGTATSAGKWTTPRTLSLTGSVTGSASIDGSGNISINTTTAHNHDWRYPENHLTSYSFTDKQPLSRYVTFDANGPDGGPGGWINGWISVHNNYLASYLVQVHRSDDWYVGWNQWSTTNNNINPAPTWRKLIHSGNIDSQNVNQSVWTTLLKPIDSTTTASASTWNIPSGSKQVWGERFSDSGLKYTDNGTQKTVTDTGDWTIWLTPNATSDVATLSMRIDGTYYGNFSGNLSGNATSAGNADTVDNLHASDFVRAYTTTNDNIDSDWGQSFKTFDPIPSGTPPAQNPNISTINIGNNFNRRKQFALTYSTDDIYYRRRVDGAWKSWVHLLHDGNTYAANANGSDVTVTCGTSATLATINGTTIKIKVTKPTYSASDVGAIATSAGVTAVTWDKDNKKITRTINDSAADVVQFAAGDNITLTSAAGKLTIKATDTTYSSLSAASGGTAVSLVTTGEKYTWNQKLSSHGPSYGKVTVSAQSASTSALTEQSTATTPAAKSANETLKFTTANKWIVATGTESTTAGSDEIKIAHLVPSSISNSGPTANQTPGYGDTFNIPKITLDEAGHVTGIGTITVKIPASDNTNTLNTAGSTDSTSKLYLIGATSQDTNPQTYSDSHVFETNGSFSAKTLGVNADTDNDKVTLQWNSTDSSLNFVFA